MMLQPIRILLADDHVMLRQGTAEMLRKEADIEIVVEADNGQQAIDLTWRLRPDIVVMDVRMPVMDGVSVIRRLRELPEHARTHVLVVSTEDNAGKVREALLSGASSFLRKPFTLEQIGELLGKILPTLSREGAA